MKNVVAYLIEHFADLSACPMLEDLGAMLESEGFDDEDIGKTLLFMHLINEVASVDTPAFPSNSMRVFNIDEASVLSPEIRGFLHQLCAENAINAVQREYIIHALMHLPYDEITLEVAKTLAILVLWAHRSELPMLVGDELMSVMQQGNIMH